MATYEKIKMRADVFLRMRVDLILSQMILQQFIIVLVLQCSSHVQAYDSN